MTLKVRVLIRKIPVPPHSKTEGRRLRWGACSAAGPGQAGLGQGSGPDLGPSGRRGFLTEGTERRSLSPQRVVTVVPSCPEILVGCMKQLCL